MAVANRAYAYWHWLILAYELLGIALKARVGLGWNWFDPMLTRSTSNGMEKHVPIQNLVCGNEMRY